MENGQTFSEWWQQKKTRIKYLRQQAAILGILKETIEKGYEGAEEGVDSVGAIAEEELAQHAQSWRNWIYWHRMGLSG